MKSEVLLLITALIGAATAEVFFEEKFPDGKPKFIDFSQRLQILKKNSLTLLLN